MRNIVEILKDDRNGKQLSQTETQIAVAYAQGKYDAVMELKNGNNSNINSVLDKIRAEIQGLRNCSCSCSDGIIDDVEDIIDKYKAESEDKE